MSCVRRAEGEDRRECAEVPRAVSFLQFWSGIEQESGIARVRFWGQMSLPDGVTNLEMNMKKTLTSTAVFATAILTFCTNTNLRAADADATAWPDSTIPPVLNPVFFEEPHIRSEIRPIFMYQNIHKNFATAGGDLQLYAMEVRWAATERLGIIATKDGYVDGDLGALMQQNGFADISVGAKYAVIDNREDRFVLTPGFELELPIGNRDVFQGSGKGEWDLFVAAAKGFDSFNLTANVGGRIPNDMSRNTAQLHYSLQADKPLHRWFQPFVAANAFTTLNGARTTGLASGLNTEGFDLINFGSGNAAGKTQATIGAGFRSRLKKNLLFGFGYEKALGAPKSIIDDRFTVDFVIRF